MTDLYLYGCGGHGKVVLNILQRQGRTVTAFIDSNPPSGVTHIQGIPVYEADYILPTLPQGKSEWIISIGSNSVRQRLEQQLQQLGHRFTTAVHPSAQLGFGVEIGPGTVVMAQAVINCDSKIGRHVIVNAGAIIDHDCVVGSYCHLSPSTTLCGHVKLGNNVLLGVGSQVASGLEIADQTTCAAGTIITQSMRTS